MPPFAVLKKVSIHAPARGATQTLHALSATNS